MKIALPIDGDTLESSINNSFGRTKNFIVVSGENLEYELIDNLQNLNATQGAGIQSAKNVAQSGANAVITLHCGPKAFKVLSGADIKIYIGKKGTIKQNIEALTDGLLEEMNSANMESHWV